MLQTGKDFYFNNFFLRSSESISEEDILNWIKIIKNRGIIEKSIKHLIKVAEKAIYKSTDFDYGLNIIVKFVVQSILRRISDKIEDN